MFKRVCRYLEEEERQPRKANAEYLLRNDQQYEDNLNLERIKTQVNTDSTQYDNTVAYFLGVLLIGLIAYFNKDSMNLNIILIYTYICLLVLLIFLTFFDSKNNREYRIKYISLVAPTYYYTLFLLFYATALSLGIAAIYIGVFALVSVIIDKYSNHRKNFCQANIVMALIIGAVLGLLLLSFLMSYYFTSSESVFLLGNAKPESFIVLSFIFVAFVFMHDRYMRLYGEALFKLSQY